MNIEELVLKQRDYFESGMTKSVTYRKEALKKLQKALIEHEKELYASMKQDMNKCEFEVFMTELGLCLDEIRYHLKHLTKWAGNHKVRTPLSHFKSQSYTSPEPYGVALIIAPWNYPILLSIEPLIGAISAGCCAILKPSAYAPATSAATAGLIREAYEESYLAVVEGGRQQNTELLNQKFDYIFFTGSVAVGHVVMEAAAKYLTPMTLELGGKSPVIVDQTANIKVAARRILFGKTINAGQTCVEPDYLMIHRDVKEAFIQEYRNALKEFFPNGNYQDMNVIISEKHFNRVTGLLDSGVAVAGGMTDPERRFVEPTLLDQVSKDSPIMQEEIFGPILPMIPFTELSECVEYIRSGEKPLALYLFTTDKENEKYILSNCSFGGGCINDTVIHLASSHMGFGGVGGSGMGSYHGKLSFDTFTHYRSIVNKANWLDLRIRYRPYTRTKKKLLHIFLH